MSSPFSFFPVSASSVSGEIDLLYLFILAVCAFFTYCRRAGRLLHPDTTAGTPTRSAPTFTGR
jgi:hypothetical protein